MENSFKESMRWLHTWSGLIVGWLLFAIFVTGTSAYYKDEITAWMKPEFHKAIVSENAIQIAINKAIENTKNSNKVNVSLPNSRSNVIAIRAFKPQTNKKQKRRRTPATYYNATTGDQIKETTKTAGGNFLYRFHFELHGVSRYLGRWIVGIASMAMLVAIITGILIHKRIFKDIFTFRPKNNTRGWMDAHILPAVAALPFLIMITYSGLVLFGNLMFPHSLKTYYDGNFMKYRQDLMAVYSKKNEIDINDKVGKIINNSTSTRIINTNTQRNINRHNSSNANKILKAQALRQIEKIKQNNKLANNITSEKLLKIIENANKIWPNNIGSFTITKIKDRYMVEVTSKNPSNIFNTRVSKESITYDANTAEVIKQITPPTNESSILNTSTALRSLHEAKFADSTLRFFFFLSGILGIVIAGTGLILWTEKRKKKNLYKKSFGFWLVEKLNLGTIMGLFIAIGIYFIANRIITVDENIRRVFEINTFFITWLLAYIYAFIRNTKKAWKEQLLFATIIFASIPFINAFVVFDSFSQIFTRDNMFIYFDLFSFLVAGIFILVRFILLKIERRKA